MEKKKEEIKEQLSKAHIQKKDQAKIMFRQNRKFDLHIGRNVITFLGRETKEIPNSWLLHKDFQNVKKYFVIKEA